MKEMAVKNIVVEWLKAHECDGLCHTDCECGCALDDFFPCGEPGFECVAAVEGPGPPEREGDYDTWMVPKEFPVEGEGEADERLVTLTPAECELLIHGLQLADEQGSTNREEWPLIEPPLEKLGYNEKPLAEGEETDER